MVSRIKFLQKSFTFPKLGFLSCFPLLLALTSPLSKILSTKHLHSFSVLAVSFKAPYISIVTEVLVTTQYCFLHVFRKATQVMLSLENLALSTDSFSHGRKNSLDIINYVIVTKRLPGLILRMLQSTVFILFMLILELSFPSTVRFPYPRVRRLKKEPHKLFPPLSYFKNYSANVWKRNFATLISAEK